MDLLEGFRCGMEVFGSDSITVSRGMLDSKRASVRHDMPGVVVVNRCPEPSIPIARLVGRTLCCIRHAWFYSGNQSSLARLK